MEANIRLEERRRTSMPSTYAHYRLGQQVINSVPKWKKNIIEKNKEAAIIGFSATPIRFLDNNRDFERVDITELLPESLRKDTAKKGYITLYPNADGTDGFFSAKVKRVKSSD